MVVYNQGIKGTWKGIEERVDGREEQVMVINGDWNGRRGRADKRGPRERRKQAIKRQENKHGKKNSAKVPGRETLDDNQ